MEGKVLRCRGRRATSASRWCVGAVGGHGLEPGGGPRDSLHSREAGPAGGVSGLRQPPPRAPVVGGRTRLLRAGPALVVSGNHLQGACRRTTELTRWCPYEKVTFGRGGRPSPGGAGLAGS